MFNLSVLLAQIGIILITARIFGWLFHKIHQPKVVGEMVAGFILGPSFLGWLTPSVSAALFPSNSLEFLNSLSQIGLLIFMFLVGLDLKPQILRERSHVALVTSHVSIIFPYLLGSILAIYLYPRLSDASVSFTNFALFMGIAISITAFPVLARILTEHNLLRTPLGAVAISCAAVDDVTAWCLLASVVLLVRASEGTLPLWMSLLGLAIYIGVMLYGIRRALHQLEVRYQKRGSISHNMLGMIVLLILMSSWMTEYLGIHALFGAFLMGTIMPKEDGFIQALNEKLESISVVLLVPLFFAFTGLRTRFGLINGAEMWCYCTLIIVVAVLGKWGGSTIAARATGLSWREAGALGVLMNTRGLVEVVVLNIGLDIEVISPALFAMMVLMAITTTFMTAPLLQLFYSMRPSAHSKPIQAEAELKA
jgi:Kef-type K+ transport system membrane component KefB